MVRPRALRWMIAALLVGGGAWLSTGCLWPCACSCEEDEAASEKDERLTVSGEQYRKAMEDGEISTTECRELCSGASYGLTSFEIDADAPCRATREIDAEGVGGEGGGPSGEGGSGGDDANDEVLLRCEFVGRQLCY